MDVCLVSEECQVDPKNGTVSSLFLDIRWLSGQAELSGERDQRPLIYDGHFPRKRSEQLASLRQLLEIYEHCQMASFQDRQQNNKKSLEKRTNGCPFDDVT